MENVIDPSLSALFVATAQVHVFPEGLFTETALSMLFPPPSFMVHVGDWIVSEAVNVSVTVSPSFALPVPAVAMPTVPSVGAVVSSVYDCVATEPGFPAASTILSLMLLAPLSVALVESAVPSAVA